MSELTCQELVELVTDYLEGALSTAEIHSLESHLSTCRSCDNFLSQIRQTIELTGKLTEDDIAPPARDELLNVFRNWKQNRSI